MHGFGSFAPAAHFCTAHDELRDYLPRWQRQGEPISLAEQRQMFRDHWTALLRLIGS